MGDGVCCFRGILALGVCCCLASHDSGTRRIDSSRRIKQSVCHTSCGRFSTGNIYLCVMINITNLSCGRLCYSIQACIILTVFILVKCSRGRVLSEKRWARPRGTMCATLPYKYGWRCEGVGLGNNRRSLIFSTLDGPVVACLSLQLPSASKRRRPFF